jgi:hypothetical protein
MTRALVEAGKSIKNVAAEPVERRTNIMKLYFHL